LRSIGGSGGLPTAGKLYVGSSFIALKYSSGNSRTRCADAGDQHRREHEKSTQPVRNSQVGSAFATAIEDQQLMFNEHGLGDDGT
jgi:hypothetical protein